MNFNFEKYADILKLYHSLFSIVQAIWAGKICTTWGLKIF